MIVGDNIMTVLCMKYKEIEDGMDRTFNTHEKAYEFIQTSGQKM